MKTDKTFTDWTIDDLYDIFGLHRQKECSLLEEWIKSEEPLSEIETYLLDFYLKTSKPFMKKWKEADLRDNFIAPIVKLVNFNLEDKRLATFSEAKLKVTVNDTTLKGTVDWMTAMGFSSPKTPFFFIHEYKPLEERVNDGTAQLLAAMLAAQNLNKKPTDNFMPYSRYKIDPNMPIYGCYIIGNLWWFLILNKNYYCESNAFDAAKITDLTQIFRILKKQKRMIVERIDERMKF